MSKILLNCKKYSSIQLVVLIANEKFPPEFDYLIEKDVSSNYVHLNEICVYLT